MRGDAGVLIAALIAELRAIGKRQGETGKRRRRGTKKRQKAKGKRQK
jgi:hypothetical protein